METWGMIVFSIALLIISAFLVPASIKIISVLNDIANTMKTFTSTLKGLCDSMTEVTKELTEARLRDRDIKNELNRVRDAMHDHIQEGKRKEA